MASSINHYQVNVNSLDEQRIRFGCSERHPNKNNLLKTRGLFLFRVTLNLEMGENRYGGFVGVTNDNIFSGFLAALSQAQACIICLINLSASHNTYFGKC